MNQFYLDYALVTAVRSRSTTRGRHIKNTAETTMTVRLTRRAIRLLEGQGYRVTLEPAA